MENVTYCISQCDILYDVQSLITESEVLTYLLLLYMGSTGTVSHTDAFLELTFFSPPHHSTHSEKLQLSAREKLGYLTTAIESGQ